MGRDSDAEFGQALEYRTRVALPARRPEAAGETALAPAPPGEVAADVVRLKVLLSAASGLTLSPSSRTAATA